MAGSIQLFKNLGRTLRNMPTSGITGWRLLSKVFLLLADALKIKISIDGGDISEIDGGVHIRITPGSEDEAGPWHVSRSGGNIIVTGSTVGGMVVEDGTFAESPGV